MNAIILNNSLISAPRNLSWLVAGALAFSAIHASAGEKNLLEDGSFEQGSGAEISGAWSVKAREPVAVTREKISGGSGDWVLKIHIPDGTKGWTVDVRQDVDMSSFKAGDTVTISAVAKVEGNGFPGSHAAQFFLTPQVKHYVAPLGMTLPHSPADDWKEIRHKFTLPEDFDQGIPNGFCIRLASPPDKPADGDLDLFFDDIQIVGG